MLHLSLNHLHRPAKPGQAQPSHGTLDQVLPLAQAHAIRKAAGLFLRGLRRKPVLCAVDKADQRQHHRHFHQHADHGGQRRA